MATIERFEDMICWQKAREVCKMLGMIIDAGRFGKNYRLIHQIEGSSGSIMDNIAEGFERGSKMEFILFLGYAKGSCGELRSQLYRAADRKFISELEFDQLMNNVIYISKLIQKLIKYLQGTSIAGSRKNLPVKEL